MTYFFSISFCVFAIINWWTGDTIAFWASITISAVFAAATAVIERLK